MAGIHSLRVAETPVAVIDFETTGLTPGFDRVVEVSVVRIDPGQKPRIVFDTLVNPSRRMGATDIHGITDADVANAPRFEEIAGELLDATRGCVISSFNVYFDIKFLNFELANSGVNHYPPHFCLMYLRTMLGLGPRCSLEKACQARGIDFSASHVAANDAMAAGQLFVDYLPEIANRGVRTYADLANLKSYKFVDSFSCLPFPGPSEFGLERFRKFVSRLTSSPPVDPIRHSISAYWDILKSVLSDLEITDDEQAVALAEQKRGGLNSEQIRLLHVRAFASVMSQFSIDQRIDDREARKLRKLYQCLSKLGWAPGE